MFRFIQSLFFSLFFLISSFKCSPGENKPKTDDPFSEITLPATHMEDEEQPNHQETFNKGSHYKDFRENITINRRSVPIIGF